MAASPPMLPTDNRQSLLNAGAIASIRGGAVGLRSGQRRNHLSRPPCCALSDHGDSAGNGIENQRFACRTGGTA